MPFNTYTDLQASVAGWLKRNNLGDRAADFITLAEARLNRRLRLSQMRTFFSITPSQQFVTLPGDYNQAIRITYGTQKLDFRPEDSADSWMEDRACGNEFTILGGRLWLLTKVDGVSKLTVHYYQDIEPLSDTNPSNWLLQDAPDIYLYASLLEAEPYIKNDERIQVWTLALTTAIDDITTNDSASQHSGSSLAIKKG